MKIAFGHKLGVGKDTAVDYLITTQGGTKYSFSQPLYDMLYYCQDICGFERKKDRKFLIWVGSEWARKQNDRVWIDALLNRVSTTEAGANSYVSDVRFQNEFDALKEDGWVCVKIIRVNVDDNRVGTGDSKHISETALDGETRWDYVLYNNGNLDNFYIQLDELVNNITFKYSLA